MKRLSLLLVLLCGLSLAQEPALPPDASDPVQVAKAIPATATVAPATAPEAATEDDSPVPLPSLGHFARLWTDSLFTTRAMPLPEAPSGPSFTDNLSLSGTFEDRGKLTAILIDKTTSNIVQVYIGEDNEQGIRIAKIVPGPSPDKMRIQLQKGNQSGWVNFSDGPAETTGSIPDPASAMQQQPGAAAMPHVAPAVPMVPKALPFTPAAEPMPAALPSSSLRGGMPAAMPSLPGDPPTL